MKTMYQTILRFLDESEGWRDDQPYGAPEQNDNWTDREIDSMLADWDLLPDDAAI